MKTKEPKITPAALGSKEAAEYLSITPAFLARLTKSGVIPHFRLGRLLRYSVAALDKFMEEQSTTEWKDFIEDRKKPSKAE